jgi:amino acid permease
VHASTRTGVVVPTENIYAMVLNKRKQGSKFFNLLLKVVSTKYMSKWIAIPLSYLPLPKEYQVDG